MVPAEVTGVWFQCGAGEFDGGSPLPLRGWEGGHPVVVLDFDLGWMGRDPPAHPELALGRWDKPQSQQWQRLLSIEKQDECTWILLGTVKDFLPTVGWFVCGILAQFIT
jgi:hypothetical protein